MRLIITIAIPIFFLIGCKQDNTCKSTLPPNVFYFVVHKNGSALADDVNSKVRMFYMNGANRIYRYSSTSDDTTFVFPGAKYSPNLQGSNVLANGYISEPKTWYVELPDGDIDTLNINVAAISCEQGIKDRCYCTKPFTSVIFNGVNTSEYVNAKTANGKIIYLLDK